MMFMTSTTMFIQSKNQRRQICVKKSKKTQTFKKKYQKNVHRKLRSDAIGLEFDSGRIGTEPRFLRIACNG